MAQDTQFRTDQFNEQVRQASEARIDRSIESMGRSIGQLGQSIIQQGQFGEQMDLRRDQFALTKQQAAVDLYFKTRRDEELRVMSAARAAKAAQGLQEGQLKLQAIQQSDATKHGVEMNKMIRQEAKMRLRVQAEQMGGEIDPGTGEFRERPPEPSAALPEGVKNYTRGAGLVWQADGEFYAHDPRRGSRRKITKGEYEARVRSAGQARQEKLGAQANIEADNIRAELAQYREQLELGPPEPGSRPDILMQRLDQIYGGYGGGQRRARQKKPTNFMQGFNRGFEASKADDTQLKTFVKKDVVGGISNITDPELRKSIQHLKKNSVNFEKWFRDTILNQRNRKGIPDGRADREIASSILMGIANGVEMPGLIMKEGKIPSAPYGEHNGERFERTYKGLNIPSRESPDRRGTFFDDAEAYELKEVYGPAWDERRVVSASDLIDIKGRGLVAFLNAVPEDKRLAFVRRRMIQRQHAAIPSGSQEPTPAGREWWGSLSTQERLGYGKDGFVIADPKFEGWLKFVSRALSSPSARRREEEIRKAKAHREQRVRKRK